MAPVKPVLVALSLCLMLTTTASAQVDLGLFQFQMATVELFNDEACKDVYASFNATRFGSCTNMQSGTAYTLYQPNQGSRTASVTYRYSSGCSWNYYYSGYLPIDGSCAPIGSKYGKLKPTWVLAPPTAYTPCHSEGFYLDPTSSPTINVYRQTVDNYTAIENGLAYVQQTQLYNVLNTRTCSMAANETNAFMQFTLRGQFTYDSVKQLTSQQVTFTGTSASVVVNNNTGASVAARKAASQLIDMLNSQCACSGTWQLGVMRNINIPGSCTPVMPDKFWLCYVLAGGNARIAMQTQNMVANGIESVQDAAPLTGSDGMGVGGLQLSNGFARSYFNSSIRHKYSNTMSSFAQIPNLNNNDINDCEFDVWTACSPQVESAAAVCSGQQEEPWVSLCVMQVMKDTSTLNKCCPCLTRYGKQYKMPWLSSRCFTRF
eukprot:m.182899 g.182899  ORF g.182899 m.182899 type:complete len:432 (-) comp14679_c0_seq1:304-1599(-)